MATRTPQSFLQGTLKVGTLYIESASGAIIGVFTNAGAPTSGTSGTYAGEAPPGSLLSDTTNTKLYINTNTQASPTWTVVGTQS